LYGRWCASIGKEEKEERKKPVRVKEEDGRGGREGRGKKSSEKGVDHYA
jgi:hypothetical protein